MPLQPFRNVGQVDANLQGIGAIQNIQKTQNQQKRNALLDMASQEFDLNAPVREAQRQGTLDEATLKSIEAGAIQAFPFIQAGDDAGLTRNIQQRRQALIEQGRPTQETDEIFGMLNSGDQGQIDQAKQIITAIVTSGQSENNEQKFARIEAAKEYDRRGNGSSEDTRPQMDGAGNVIGPSPSQSRFITANRNTQSFQTIANQPQIVDVTRPSSPQPVGNVTPEDVVSAAGDVAGAQEAAKQTEQIAAIAPKATAVREQVAIDAAPEALLRAESRIDNASLALNDVDKAMGRVDGWTTGITGWVAQIKPGSDRRGLDGLYETLRSRLGIETLGEMREQSADGSSGFGQLNELELRGIQAAVSNLDPNLPPEDQVRNLNILRRHILRQRAVQANIIRVNEELLTEAQGQRQVQRDWLDIDSEMETAVAEPSAGDTQTINDTTFTIRKKQ